ncbi:MULTISPECIES: hypothetical protein [Xanthomonas]|uniref:hypothetical protein n=1 Tax=Xanthomonas TaxID=338 RepID=UPI001ED91330|nr:hypothetical protein [Xanthomonas phaseoli]
MNTPASPLRRSRVLVPEWRDAEFSKRLAALNTKAERFGLDPISVEQSQLVRYASIPEQTEEGSWYTLRRIREGEHLPPDAGIVHVREIELSFPVVKLGDWQVVAQLEATEAGNLVFAVSADDADLAETERRRECPMACEHCNVQRERKVSYLLRDAEAGSFKQVGSSCLEDFTGIDPAKALFLARMAEFVSFADASEELEGRRANAADHVRTQDYLARVLFLTERGGFVSTAKARETYSTPTYMEATDLPYALTRDHELRQAFDEAYERLSGEAAEIVSWYAGREAQDGFEENVKTLLLAQDVKIDRKHLAFVAAAVPSYNRQMRATKDAELAAVSKHVGEVGGKLELALSVRNVATFETGFGVQQRVNMQDSEGNRFSWKTGSAPTELVAQSGRDRPFFASFKVKKHDEYRGSQITEVSHLKFKGWCPEPEPPQEQEALEAQEADDAPEP